MIQPKLTAAQRKMIDHQRKRMAERLNAFGIDGLHFFNECENAVELFQRFTGLFRRQFKVRQMSDTCYIGLCERHSWGRHVAVISLVNFLVGRKKWEQFYSALRSVSLDEKGTHG